MGSAYDKILKKKKKSHHYFLAAKVGLFCLTLLVFAVIGLLLPLRPATSSLEKRELAQFPTFSIGTFLDGSFFSAIDTWYADTYPMRDQLLAANTLIGELHGLQDAQLIAGSGQTQSDEIPTGDAADAGEDVQAEVTAEPETSSEADFAEAEETEEAGVISEGASEVFGAVYITQGRAYELFYFVTDYSNRYCKALNTFQAKVGDDVTVYDLVAPTNAGIILDDALQNALGSSDQSAAADYIYANLDDRIRTVSVYDNIKAHDEEYVYFRTDHHWTQLGAYYAYEVFAEVKGVTANRLEQFETTVSEGFLGSFYSESQSSSLRENADTVTGYIPNGTNEISGINREGNAFTGSIVADGEGYGESDLYLTYIKGDNPYSEIHNSQITDSSALLVVKESYGNCFVPFLVDHYQDIYIVDYRYYKDNIYELIEEKGVTEVLFLNNLNAINSDNLVSYMEQMIAK